MERAYQTVLLRWTKSVVVVGGGVGREGEEAVIEGLTLLAA